MSDKAQRLKSFYDHLARLHRLGGIRQVLGWDQKVMMPAEGASSRAEQLELLAKLIHQEKKDPHFLSVLDELATEQDSLGEHDQVNVRETKRILDRDRKLPDEFVARCAKAGAEGYAAWKLARQENDFKSVLPYLERNIELIKERAEYMGYEKGPYDAMLDVFEPGSTLEWVKPLLLELAQNLQELLPRITEKLEHPALHQSSYSIQAQAALSERVVQDLGYSLDAGRLDATTHPFACSVAFGDVRITSRYFESDYLSSLFSALHEAGHALYELGFLPEHEGTPMGRSVSLAIHESQSRFWENSIGRSQAFAAYLKPLLQEFFPEEYAKADQQYLWLQMNRVQPSLIRVEADEVSYSLHIVIRMLLEEQVINENLPARELPAAWRELYQKYLGLAVPDDSQGVLQDVHWYDGNMGYFPTYALGNLHAALILNAIERDIGKIDGLVRCGDFAPILSWLRENIHQHGMRYTGQEIAVRLSGEELKVEPFLAYLRQKYCVE